ncbi:MAG: hypothetical protein H6813_01605 [Phycisphaeraceae bacterium]|nr:hypothetical protein [Phycisphaeraceae bacterium]
MPHDMDAESERSDGSGIAGAPWPRLGVTMMFIDRHRGGMAMQIHGHGTHPT